MNLICIIKESKFKRKGIFIMNNNEMIQRKIDTGNLLHINGKILRTLNVISESRCRLSSLEYSFGYIEHDSFVNSVRYLNMSGYVELKDCWTKKTISFKESKFDDTEISLTAKGIRVLCGVLEDECVEV